MLFHFTYFFCSVPSNPLWKKKRLTINNKKYIFFIKSHQIHVTTHKIEESVGMDVNTDTAALGSGVKTNDSITVTGKPTWGDSNTEQAISEFSPPFWPQKIQAPKEYDRNWSRAESAHGKYIDGEKKTPQMILMCPLSPHPTAKVPYPCPS